MDILERISIAEQLCRYSEGPMSSSAKIASRGMVAVAVRRGGAETQIYKLRTACVTISLHTYISLAIY